jgi:hypothetical protein
MIKAEGKRGRAESKRQKAEGGTQNGAYRFLPFAF